MYLCDLKIGMHKQLDPGSNLVNVGNLEGGGGGPEKLEFYKLKKLFFLHE